MCKLHILSCEVVERLLYNKNGSGVQWSFVVTLCLLSICHFFCVFDSSSEELFSQTEQTVFCWSLGSGYLDL
jgi:hypothetical protein